MIPNAIFVPATGSFVVNILEETDDGYVCSYMTRQSRVFILKENVFRNDEQDCVRKWNYETESLEAEEAPEFAIKHTGHIEEWNWSK